jgi:hypothetical protein
VLVTQVELDGLSNAEVIHESVDLKPHASAQATELPAGVE